MRYLRLYLKNYIGIYNGMLLNEIDIDFSKCIHNTVVIRGQNGSGKSTIFKSLSPLPDSNEQFIPNLPAQKSISIIDNNIVYNIDFFHNIKPNGERDNTKAYFKKITPDGIVTELNPNGNVSSYRDILFDEFKLDSNFIALSQLSTDDKGLAIKKPAERKRFINSIISSLEVYNGIYKTLTKKSNTYKSLISNISNKINQLGDENNLRNTLEELNSRLSNLQSSKSSLLEQLGVFKSQVSSIDTNGEIQRIIETQSKNLSILESNINKLQKIINKIIEDKKIDSSIEISLALEAIKSNIVDIESKLSYTKELLSSQLNSRNELDNDLTIKFNRYNSLLREEMYEEIKSALNKETISHIQIEKEFNDIGLSVATAMTKNEFIIALNTLKNIKNNIDTLKNMADNYSMLSEAIDVALNGKQIISLAEAKENLSSISNTYREEHRKLDSLLAYMEIFNTLKNRPEECNIDSCPFISQAISLRDNNIVSKVEEQKKICDNIDSLYIEATDKLNYYETLYNMLSYINNIISIIHTNQYLLSKLPNGEIYSNSKELFERFLSAKNAFEEINNLYHYIDYANKLEIYNNQKEVIANLEKELEIQKNKNELVKELFEETNNLRLRINSIEESIKETNLSITNTDVQLRELKSLQSIYEDLLVKKSAMDKMILERDEANKLLEENKQKISSVSFALEKVKEINLSIIDINKRISEVETHKSKISYSLELIKNYNKELAELNENYEYIETIKYYSSPTTGIQLVFMNLYMDKIISLANELLNLLFNGQFVLQPFIINENEFRIPCVGSGYMNDDISSMSSGQVSMISMIISFALLYHSSTSYNIIKLDEIDAPLDENNRIMFLEVLHKIMGIMNTEQCILISHNTELPLDSCDCIILKTPDYIDYSVGNVIWSYNKF